jgi:hypothetical protein
MAKIAVENRFGSLTTYNYPADTYDSTKMGLGSLIKQYDGAGNEDDYVGPPQIAIARPFEGSAGASGVFPWAMQWSSNIDWVFLADYASAAATRRIQLYTYNRTTASLSWEGYITLGYPYGGTQGTYTIRALRITYDKYTTGSASVSGTAVSGTGGTAWLTDRLAIGSRIGFGSKDPTLIVQWYEISAIGSDSSITLLNDAGTIGSGDYVIEELRAITVVTNGTTTSNGGLFVAKGLRIENFTGSGTSILAAVSTDNVRANFWLKDAATNLNTIAFGAGLQDRTDWQNHFIFVGDTTTTPYLYKHNLRAALTVASGASTNAFVLKTGLISAVTGAIGQNNNGRIITALHGTGANIPCFYFTTASRVYRSIDVTTILSGSTIWLTESVTEIPPGGVSTFAATGALSSIEYSETLDKFYIATTGRCYLTQFKPDGSQWDRIMLSDNKQLFQSIADNSLTAFPEAVIATFSIWTNQGILYLAGIGNTAVTNFLYAVPTAVDWEYAATTNQRCILPKILTPNASSYVRYYMNTQQVMGGRSGKNLGLQPEPVRIYCRTTGIDDNSGAWGDPLDYSGDLSTIQPADSIQFMLEWRVIGPFCIPGKVFSVAVVYEDFSTDSHFQPSVANSDKTNKRFAWRFSTAFGNAVPRLRIRLYDAVTGEGPLVDDDSTTQTGTWEKSTDGGGIWADYDTDDKANDITYIRFTPASLADNTRVRALLTLY